MAFGKEINKLLTNKYVLYVVLFLAITNVLGYLSVRDFKSLTIFIVIGLLTQYFSKNMIVILLTTMLATSLIMILERKSKIMEGLKSRKRKEAVSNRKKKEGVTSRKIRKESVANRKKKKRSEAMTEGNYLDTVKENYKNLENMIGGEGMANLAKETEGLLTMQNKLTKSMEAMEPMIKNAEGLMTKLNPDRLTGIIDKLGGIVGSGTKNP